MRIRQWPNGLGFDVGNHEIWLLPGGAWGVRWFRPGSPVPARTMMINPVALTSVELPRRMVEAVRLCRARSAIANAEAR